LEGNRRRKREIEPIKVWQVWWHERRVLQGNKPGKGSITTVMKDAFRERKSGSNKALRSNVCKKKEKSEGGGWDYPTGSKIVFASMVLKFKKRGSKR